MSNTTYNISNSTGAPSSTRAPGLSSSCPAGPDDSMMFAVTLSSTFCIFFLFEIYSRAKIQLADGPQKDKFLESIVYMIAINAFFGGGAIGRGQDFLNFLTWGVNILSIFGLGIRFMALQAARNAPAAPPAVENLGLQMESTNHPAVVPAQQTFAPSYAASRSAQVSDFSSNVVPGAVVPGGSNPRLSTQRLNRVDV